MNPYPVFQIFSNLHAGLPRLLRSTNREAVMDQVRLDFPALKGRNKSEFK
jgi:hypothetical protein